MLIRNFGLAGHAGMVLAVAVFLLSDSSRSWADRLLGTTTQKLTALFVVALALSVFLAGFDQVILLRYGQVVMLLFTVAIFVQGFGGGDHIRKLAWAAAGSAALLFILSILSCQFWTFTLACECSLWRVAGALRPACWRRSTGVS